MTSNPEHNAVGGRAEPTTATIPVQSTVRTEPGFSGEPRGGPAATSSVHAARMAGLLYLVVAVLGGFAQIVRMQVYVPGNPSTTAANLTANASLVRLSFVADLVQNLVWLLLALALYRLLQHAGKHIARAMVAFVVVSVGIAMLNMVHQIVAVLVATDPAYAGAFGTQGSHGMVQVLMDEQYYGYLIAQMSWLWLFALGLLGLRSGMFPRALSVLLMLGTVTYVVDAVVHFLAPGVAGGISNVLVVPEIVSELALLLYLLIKGVKAPRPVTAAHVVT